MGNRERRILIGKENYNVNGEFLWEGRIIMVKENSSGEGDF